MGGQGLKLLDRQRQLRNWKLLSGNGKARQQCFPFIRLRFPEQQVVRGGTQGAADSQQSRQVRLSCAPDIVTVPTFGQTGAARHLGIREVERTRPLTQPAAKLFHKNGLFPRQGTSSMYDVTPLEASICSQQFGANLRVRLA